jgi:hypothetical protein
VSADGPRAPGGRTCAGVALRLFATAWLVYVLHFATNIVREHYPAFSLAERGTLRVDPYVGLHPDLFTIDGRGGFINNNPGASLLGALPYALARPAVDVAVERAMRRRAAAGAPPPTAYDDPRPNRRRFFQQTRERGLDVRFGLAAGVIHAGFTAPVSAAAAVAVCAVLVRLGASRRAAAALALLFAFGTPFFFRSAYLNQNLLVAQLSLFAFAALLLPRASAPPRRALAVAGLCAGFALVCDYSGLVAIAGLGAYALARCVRALGAGAGLRRAGWMVASGAAAAAILPLYQAWAFGDPWLPAQRYMPATAYSGFGWSGFNWPAGDLAWQNLFDPRFGLFAAGPLLLLAFAAPVAARRGAPRLGAPELALAFGLSAGFWLFASCVEYARLQWNTGVRYLVPCVPFLFLAAASVLVRLPRPLAVGIALGAVGWSWAHAMVRETPWESVRAVLAGGPQLPWLTSVWRSGARAPLLLRDSGPVAWPLLLPAAAALAILWRPSRSRAGVLDEGI